MKQLKNIQDAECDESELKDSFYSKICSQRQTETVSVLVPRFPPLILNIWDELVKE